MASSHIKMTDVQRSEEYPRDVFLKAAMVKAVTENKIEIFRDILETEGWPKSYPWLGYDLLVKAINHGHKEITNILLDNGVPVTMKLHVNTPLHLAAARSNDWLDIMERLVNKGALVEVRNAKRYTSLHVAFSMDPTDEKIDLLLRCHLRQSKNNVVDENGVSFLHIACSRPHLDIVQKIVEANKDSVKNSIIQSKCTPLHFAVEYGRLKIAEYLIKNGADLYSRNIDGSTPLHFALKRRNARLVDILLAHDVDKRNVVNKHNLSHFMVACIGSKVDVVMEYLNMPNSENFISEKINSLSNCVGYTCLHLSAELGSIEVVEYLLDRGADCCALAVNGTITPHKLAEKRPTNDMKDLLLEHCWLRNKCRKFRAKSPDFGKYGKEYEKNVLIERTRDLKNHRRTFKKFKHMGTLKSIARDDDFIVEDL